jgi:hypothetical protein
VGIDWLRMTPKPDADPDELRRLVREQAVAFQSLYGWESTGAHDEMRDSLLGELHFGPYRAACHTLVSRIDFPPVRDEDGCAVDHPALAPCFRVYPITRNPTFPPLVRCRAGRTILPDELPGQLAEWRRWAEEAARGDHDDYLRELHWYDTADWARCHWSCLHAAAVGSLSATGAWASKPGLIAAREEILRLPEPTVPRVRLSPDDKKPWDPADLEAGYPACLAAARTLAELTRRWDRNVGGNRKLRYYENSYHLTLDEFRARAADPWLHEFFAWAGRCAELGFGLYLDY